MSRYRGLPASVYDLRRIKVTYQLSLRTTASQALKVSEITNIVSRRLAPLMLNWLAKARF